MLALFFVLLLTAYYIIRNVTNKKQSTSNFTFRPEVSELVVVVCSEDVSWIDNYSNNYKLVTVYTKCQQELAFESENVLVIKSPNIGTCDHGYLSYIVDRYDTLPLYVEFIKGSQIPDRKIFKCNKCFGSNILDKLISVSPVSGQKSLRWNWNLISKFNKKNGYKFAGEKSNNTVGKKYSDDWEWKNSKYKNIKEWVKDSDPYLNEEMFKKWSCNIIYGGHFSATREQILNTPIETWKYLFYQLTHTRSEMAHFMERTWRPLFCTNKTIPKVIHKVFLNTENNLFFTKNIKIAHQSWLSLNKSYTIKYWNLSDCRKYLVNNFNKEFIKTFDKLKPFSYKCDFFRFCIVFKEGGWYSDWLQTCLQPDLLDNLVNSNNIDLVVFKDKDGYIFGKKYDKNDASDYIQNAFFGSHANNFILKKVIYKIIENVKNKKYGSNPLMPTGPGLFGNIFCEYYNLNDNLWYKNGKFYEKNTQIVSHKSNIGNIKYKKGNDYRKMWKNKDVFMN